MKKESIVFSKPYLSNDITIMDANLSSFRYNLHAHNDYAVGMTINGEQCFTCNGEEYVSKSGNIIQFNPDEPHNGHSSGACELTYKMVYISRKAIDIFLEDTDKILRFKETVSNNQELKKSFLNLSSDLYERANIEDYSNSIDEFIYNVIRYNDLSNMSCNSNQNDDYVRNAIKFINNNIDCKLEIDEISKQIGVSKYHFIRSFKKQTKFTPYQFILNTKMELVKKELEAGIEPIIIANKFGFYDLSHLFNRFKKTYGVTPNQYQENILKTRYI
ncbi:AraC family transcriptional regulator [Acidaminobacter sp. JC074]|uniref:AraC family transcriptional regulator n=1 Tax=Acidaminobacter sp. JC074 TaxID=2530199 RepID=UPI001F11860F|nr:AraC family transcriptional regulator [Acidaminobacter sp. JC074]MCH4888902.1 AraC family transcriptional regulator [Acidaminobacter sp. JC074]